MSIISSVRRIVRDNFMEVASGEAAKAASSPSDAAQWFTGLEEQGAAYAAVLSSDGATDFDRLFSNAAINSGPFSADAVTAMLADMPVDIPQRVRGITVRAMLSHLSKSDSSAVEKVMTDASLKIVTIARLAENVSERAESIKGESAAEMAALKEKIDALSREIEAHRSVLAEIDRREDVVQAACQTRTSELNIVLSFCDNLTSPGDNAPPAESAPVIELGFSHGKEAFRSPRLSAKLNGRIAASRTRKMAMSGSGH